MTQSETLMKGIKWTPFQVDKDAFLAYKATLLQKHHDQELKLIQFGLAKYNSAKETKIWLEGMGIDCSRGTDKTVYLNPTNMAAHPNELSCLAEMKRLEALRRKFNTFENLLEEV